MKLFRFILCNIRLHEVLLVECNNTMRNHFNCSGVQS